MDRVSLQPRISGRLDENVPIPIIYGTNDAIGQRLVRDALSLPLLVADNGRACCSGKLFSSSLSIVTSNS